MSLVQGIAELPERIRSSLAASGIQPDAFQSALRTAFKPNATIPIIWLVLLRDRLLLCNTHKSRGVWREYPRESFDSIRLAYSTLGKLAIEIIHPDPMEPSLSLPLPPSVELEVARGFVHRANTLKQSTGR